MQIMLDTNVVLDVLLNRPAFVQNSAAILRVASEEIQEFITASAITDIYYIARKELRGSLQAKALIRNGFGNTTELLESMKDREDFEQSLINTIGIQKVKKAKESESDEEFFDPREAFM